MNKYNNRYEAGKILAEALKIYAGRKDTLILALPRGGVPVAYEVAKALNLPMDIFIVRKLGAPGHTELAMGAIASSGVTVFNKDVIHSLGITQKEVDEVIAAETKELQRRETAYRNQRPFPDIANKTIILIDDGIATGATMRAAITSLRHLKVAQVVVAVPVADKQLCKQLTTSVDHLVCPLQPLHFYAVGAWYDDFAQTEDAEVFSLLNELRIRHD